MITTPRLTIRPFQEDDAASLAEYLSNPAVYRFEPGAPINLEQATDLAIERAAGRDFWAVVLDETHKMVGHLYFKQVEPREFLTWELGYIFNPLYHKRGFASESAAALVRYGFEQFGIHRIVAYCHPDNIASWKVLEKIGLRREGHFLRKAFFRRGEDGSPLWFDVYEYAILREEIDQDSI